MKVGAYISLLKGRIDEKSLNHKDFANIIKIISPKSLCYH